MISVKIDRTAIRTFGGNDTTVTTNANLNGIATVASAPKLIELVSGTTPLLGSGFSFTIDLDGDLFKDDFDAIGEDVTSYLRDSDNDGALTSVTGFANLTASGVVSASSGSITITLFASGPLDLGTLTTFNVRIPNAKLRRSGADIDVLVGNKADFTTTVDKLRIAIVAPE
jgi:hypothetical protein